MKERIKHQIIESDGEPMFVIVPYEEYLNLVQPGQEVYYSQEVVERHAIEGKTLLRAWREHLGISQKEMAARLGISQAAYSRIEASARPRRTTLERAARALGIDIEQLHI